MHLVNTILWIVFSNEEFYINWISHFLSFLNTWILFFVSSRIHSFANSFFIFIFIFFLSFALSFLLRSLKFTQNIILSPFEIDCNIYLLVGLHWGGPLYQLNNVLLCIFFSYMCIAQGMAKRFVEHTHCTEYPLRRENTHLKSQLC